MCSVVVVSDLSSQSPANCEFLLEFLVKRIDKPSCHVKFKVLSSSSVFNGMGALTRSSLPWVQHTWMSGTNLLQTPRAWFSGTHKWAIFTALLGGIVSRIAGYVLVFCPLLYRSIELRSLRQSFWDCYSVCNGLYRGERWWSVCVMAADGLRPGGLYSPVLLWKMAFFLLWISVLSSL